MANIPVPVTIDAQGDISCPDTNGAVVGDTLTWSITSASGTVTSIAPGKPSPFIASPVISRGQWNATIGGAGEYTITDTAGKTRTPKITILSPVPAAKY